MKFDDNTWFKDSDITSLNKSYTTITDSYSFLHWNYSSATYDLSDIIVDRYGYKWLGWYTSQTEFVDEYRIVAGNSFDDRSFTNFVNYLFEMEFDVTGYESDTTNTTINLYAGWEANTYSIIYDYSDTGTVDYVYGKESNNGRVIVDHVPNKLGSTTALTSNLSHTDHISTIVFDSTDSTNYLQLSRTGYIFDGWTMNAKDAKLQENYNSTTKDIVTFLTINSDYASISGNVTSCQTTEAYLYYFESDNSRATKQKEYLGDSEVKENQELEHVVVLYANWTARTYEIEFNFNNNQTLNDKVGYANYIDCSTFADKIDVVGYEIENISVRVVFDTNDWFAVVDEVNTKVSHILSQITTSRIGYTFIGWYTTETMYLGEVENSSLIYKVGDARENETTLDVKTFDKSTNLKTGFMTRAEKEDVTGTVTLYAGWEQIVYTANINTRDVNDLVTGVGTSPAFLTSYLNADYKLNTDKFNPSSPTRIYEIRVKFDSQIYNIFEYNPSKLVFELINNYDFYEILIDRYGYTWTGWYFDQAAKDNILVAGHTANNLPPIGVLMTLQKFDISIYRVAIGINTNMDNDLIFNVYAGWDANTYNITYDLNDRYGINNEDPDKAVSSIATLHSISSQIKFDDLQMYYAHAERPGYTFGGWCLYYELTQEHKSVPCTFPGFNWTKPTEYKFSLTNGVIYYDADAEAFHNGVDHIMLYKKYTTDKDYVSEVLGDLETYSEHHIVLVAKWIARTYIVELDYNDVNNSNGSSEAALDPNSKKDKLRMNLILMIGIMKKMKQQLFHTISNKLRLIDMVIHSKVGLHADIRMVMKLIIHL